MDNEFKIIKDFFLQLVDSKKSMKLSNDGALLNLRNTFLTVSTDMMIEGTHFNGSENPKMIARKLLRVNLSDLAAMGAIPYGYLLNLSIPKKNSFNWIKAFVEGLKIDQKRFGIKLLGGDLSQSKKIFLSVTILGKVNKKIHNNNSATEGSSIYVSGNLGDAAIAFNYLKNKIYLEQNSRNYFIKKLFLPDPKIKLGKFLLDYSDSCTDISDGLFRDLNKLCYHSKICANIFCSKIPLSSYLKKILKNSNNKKELWQTILCGGEDYQLLFSIPKEKIDKFETQKLRNIHKIGYFSKGNGIKIYDTENKILNLSKSGFSHF